MALVLFMILASVGMGITGAAPTLRKNQERYLPQTEQVVPKKEQDNALQEEAE